MAWAIEIDLPENRDYKGTLTMYHNGNTVHTCDCLGRGTNCAANDYDHTKWWIIDGYGDTPTGSYNGTWKSPSSDTGSYGPYGRVNLVAIGGHALECGREDIQIHGGDPATSGTWKPLKPTYGCIRVSNDDQEIISNLVESYGGTGYVGVYGDQREME
jgi:hypothetical protein